MDLEKFVKAMKVDDAYPYARGRTARGFAHVTHAPADVGCSQLPNPTPYLGQGKNPRGTHAPWHTAMIYPIRLLYDSPDSTVQQVMAEATRRNLPLETVENWTNTCARNCIETLMPLGIVVASDQVDGMSIADFARNVSLRVNQYLMRAVGIDYIRPEDRGNDQFYSFFPPVKILDYKNLVGVGDGIRVGLY